MAEARTLITGEQFLEFCARQKGHARYELVKGEIKKMAPTGDVQAEVITNLGSLLHIHVRQHRLGRVLTNGGFYLRRTPDTVRGPDVAFLRSERVPPGGLPEGFFDGPPDLAVEVVSHNESAAEVEAKLRDYLASGVQRVWLVYSATRTIVAFRPDGSAQSYREGDVLTDEALLPGLSLAVREVFA